MPADTIGIRATHFYPGTHDYATVADYVNVKEVSWKLESSRGKIEVVSKHTPRPACASGGFSIVAADACLAMAGARSDKPSPTASTAFYFVHG